MPSLAGTIELVQNPKGHGKRPGIIPYLCPHSAGLSGAFCNINSLYFLNDLYNKTKKKKKNQKH